MSDLIKTLKSSETGNDVYPNIKPDNIPSDAITSAKISDGAVTTDKLASDSVTTAKIHNGAVTTAKIEDEGISTAKIGALAVTTAKIDTGAVTSNKLAESSVTGTKINDGAVSYSKLASALKNLIDGKASQDDLTALQNAVYTKTQVDDKLEEKADKNSANQFNGTNEFNNDVLIDFNDLKDSNDNNISLEDKLDDKQPLLVSGVNIKTINNQSLLGSGNIVIQGGGGLNSVTIKTTDLSDLHIIFSLISAQSSISGYDGINSEYLINTYIYATIKAGVIDNATHRIYGVSLSEMSIFDDDTTYYYTKQNIVCPLNNDNKISFGILTNEITIDDAPYGDYYVMNDSAYQIGNTGLYKHKIEFSFNSGFYTDSEYETDIFTIFLK